MGGAKAPCTAPEPWDSIIEGSTRRRSSVNDALGIFPNNPPPLPPVCPPQCEPRPPNHLPSRATAHFPPEVNRYPTSEWCRLDLRLRTAYSVELPGIEPAALPGIMSSDVMKERGLRSSCPFRARMLGVLTYVRRRRPL
jgi:hypothetical protein